MRAHGQTVAPPTPSLCLARAGALYAEGRDGSAPLRSAMRREGPLVGARGFLYVGTVPEARPPSDFTPRIVPFHPDIAIPLELPAITWAR